MIDSSNLEFHETFKPEMVYVAKILKLAAEGFSGTKAEISEYSGIPTGEKKGKVVPHIKYASFMGLVNYTIDRGVFSLNLTDLGTEVVKEDPYLSERITTWLCHYGMTKSSDGAPQWAYLVHCARPGIAASLSQDNLFAKAKLWCNVPVNNMLRKVFSVVKSSYSDGCFEQLDFLEWDNNEVIFHELSSRQDLLYVYAYALFDSWERLLPDKREITEIELKEIIGFDKIFGFNMDECDFVLDSLEDEGLLHTNRQLYPATVIRTTSAESMIPQLYSRLL